ncbi:hypothetical protein HOLleu_05469 [Holothuria leucospilota]|uniref:Uncharacterized protein n=1 Tax=Holothuria leucospilota TaxID=206669 RepID=A0A9Q1CLG5_HOLLE|nr:hypothetical protein HOLleu_05469 [Holothuria leucospilota]
MPIMIQFQRKIVLIKTVKAEDGSLAHVIAQCNLNGTYGLMSDRNQGSIDWEHLSGGNTGLKRTEMKI